MKRKLLSMLLAIAMLVSMMPTYAMATGTPEIYVDTSGIGDLKAGDSVAIPVSIKNNPGICMAYLEFEIPDALTYVSVEEKAGAQDLTWTAPNKAQWTYDAISYTGTYNEDGVLFVLNFTVNEGAEAKTYDFGVNALNGLAANVNNGSAEIGATFAGGQITIAVDTTLSFVNGSQTMDYAAAKADAEGGNALVAPGDGYYFAGWFSGLADTYKDANGYYVIDTAATGVSGTEFRPRYDTTIPTEGTYNALWIKGSSSYVVNVNDTNKTVEVVVGTDDDTALSTAITNANGARTKLVKDMTLSAMLQAEVAMHLDMNGHTVTKSDGYVFGVKVDGSTVESSRAGGGFVGSQYLFNYTTNSLLGQFALIRDVDFVASAGNIAIKIKNGATIQNCTFTGYVYLTEAGETVIDNCQVTTSNMLLKVETGTAKVSNTTMTTTWSSVYAPLQLSDGVIELGAGNTVTATSLSYLFSGTGTATFTAVDGTYQLKAGASLAKELNGTAPTVTCSTGDAASIDSTGKVIFGTSCTVTYMADGAVSTTKTGVVGYNADVTVTHTYGDGYNYKLLGWTTEENGTEPLTELVLTGDTTLYAIKARRGIISSGGISYEYDSGDVTLTAQYNNASKTTTIYNADRLGELDSLTLKAASTKYSNITFTAEALDAIAAQINGDSKNITVIMYHATSLSDGVASQLQIKFLYGSTEITLPEGVELHLYSNASKSGMGTHQKYAAYNAADADTLLDATTYIDSSNHYFVSFPLTANGTYEIVTLGSYLTESQMTGDVSVTLASDTELTVENAAKLADMNSLYITNGNAYLDFSAAALDSIAVKAGTGSVTISLEREVFTAPTDGVAARLELGVSDESSNAVDFEGAVGVWTTFPFTEGKSYRAYYVPETGDAVGLGTVIGDRNSTYKAATFTTTHFSTFEVRETTVVNGYTAGLAVTETQVRAGGETVSVTIDVTHFNSEATTQDTTFNAAEIVVSYDPALLIPVTDDLTAGTYKVDETNGILTIEFYGEPKNLGTGVFNLQFTTCDSVDADTTATVTLTSAAFADSVDARSENLIAATRDPASDTVTIQLEAFDVVYDEEVVTEGATTVVKNTEYSFTVENPNYYDYSDLKVYVGEDDNKTDITEHVTNDGNGTYTIPAQYVTGNIIIEDNRTANKYDVTINYTGDDADAAQTIPDGATYGEKYEFTIPTLEGYNYTLSKVQIGENEYTDYANENGVLTIPGTAITADIVITIEKDDTQFTVTVEGNGAGDASWTVSGDDTSVDKGETVTLTVTPAAGYKNYTVTATMAGAKVTLDTSTGNVYVLTNIDGDIVFTVTKEVTGTVEITEYLTLDADKTEDETDTSMTMFLVLYTDASASGSYIPTCNGEAMYWSDNYNAYCYLVISDTLENAKTTTTVTAGATTDGDGNAITNPTITYSINVNCSSDTAGDAADAQLVYDMYKAMYSDFDTVSMLKFLLADVNNSKDVTTEDAAAIISEILNPTTT